MIPDPDDLDLDDLASGIDVDLTTMQEMAASALELVEAMAQVETPDLTLLALPLPTTLEECEAVTRANIEADLRIAMAAKRRAAEPPKQPYFVPRRRRPFKRRKNGA